MRLAELPVSAYDGSIKGMQRRSRARARRSIRTAPGLDYKGYLESRHDAVLAGVGGGKKLYSYGYVFNGFAADLTRRAGRQAARRRRACFRSRRTSR